MLKMKGRETEITNSEVRFLRAPILKECLDKITIKKNKFTGLFKLISNPEFLMIAYSNLRGNKGLDTVGIDGKTLDGLNYEKFETLSKKIHSGMYKPKPVKRVYITKPNGGSRPLGLPSAIDKITQEAVRMVLEYIYEPKFLPSSHGFRPKRGCHTALHYYKMRFQSVSWLINMDVQECFDSINHSKVIEILAKDIDDKPFFDLM